MAKKRARVAPDLELFDMDIGGEAYVVLSLPASTATAKRAAARERLSTAERQVAGDAASGLSNAAIAKKRSRSVRTIANQLASIYRKLGVSSRAELAARLLERR